MRVHYVTVVKNPISESKFVEGREVNLELEGEVLDGFNFMMKTWSMIVNIMIENDSEEWPAPLSKMYPRQLVNKLKFVVHPSIPPTFISEISGKTNLRDRTGYPAFDGSLAFGIKPDQYANYIKEWGEILGGGNKINALIKKYVNRDEEYFQSRKLELKNAEKKFIAIVDFGDEDNVFEHVGNVVDFVRGIMTYYEFTSYNNNGKIEKLPMIFPSIYRTTQLFRSTAEITKADVKKKRVIPVNVRVGAQVFKTKPFVPTPEESEEGSDESSEESEE